MRSSTPVRVELEAREAEIEADALAAIAVPQELTRRIGRARAIAPRYREQGAIRLDFDTGERFQ